MPRVARPLEERFWEKVDKSGGPDACWPWTGGTMRGGYGVVVADGGRPLLRAHRVAYVLQNGPLRDDEKVLHKCDNPPCQNGRHLVRGTQLQNVHDAKAKGRLATGDRHGTRLHPGCCAGENNGAAKLDAARVQRIRELHARGATLREIADEVGVSRNAVNRVTLGKAWSHVP